MIRKLWSELPVVIVVAALLFLIVVGVQNCMKAKAVQTPTPNGARTP